MTWDGSGNFTREHDWAEDEALGVNIEAARMDEEDENFRAGIQAALAKNGENTVTGDIDFDGNALVLDADGDTKLDAGISDDVITIIVGGNTRYQIRSDAIGGAGAGRMLKHWIGGCQLANGTDADHDINIGPGSCVSTDGSDIMTSAATLVKTLDGGTWAVGDAQPGLDTGTLTADTGYYVWRIKRPDTGVVDATFSLSKTFAGLTVDAAYTIGQLIGYVATDGSANARAFEQEGDFFRYTNPFIDVSDALLTSNTFADGTLDVPRWCQAEVYLYFINTSGSQTDYRVWLKPKGGGESTSSTQHCAMSIAGAGADFTRLVSRVTTTVDLNSQISYAAYEPSGTGTLQIYTSAFRMLTRGAGT